MTLLQALISQGRTPEEAEEAINEMRLMVHEDLLDPEEVLYEHGLEPDYVPELLVD